MAEAHGHLLILAATDLEVAPLRGLLVGASRDERWPFATHGSLEGAAVTIASAGIGKANTAAALATLITLAATAGSIAGTKPAGRPAIMQLGIAGAYPGAGLLPGSAAVASSEFDLDLGAGRGDQWRGLESIGIGALPGAGLSNCLDLDPSLVAVVSSGSGVPSAAFATSDNVTADRPTAAQLADRHGVQVESMEGVAGAQVAAAFGLPFVELRGISNEVGDRDRRNWLIAEAVAAACEAALESLAPLLRHLATAA